MSKLRVLLAVPASLLAFVLALPVLVLWAPFRVMAALIPRLAEFLEPGHSEWQELMRFDPVLGWRLRPNLDSRYITDVDPEVYRLVTDRDGWPGGEPVAGAKVVVVGDSWAMGYAVDPERGFSALTRDLGVKALGCNGYNLVQELLLIRELGADLQGKTVVWFIYQGNDLHENLLPYITPRGYPAPFVREAKDGRTDWEIVTNHVRPGNWGNHRLSTVQRRGSELMAELHSESRLSRRALSASAFLLGEGKGLLDAVGSKLVVVGLPSPVSLRARSGKRWLLRSPDSLVVDPDRVDRELANICERLEIPYVAAKNYLSESDFHRSDDHLNEEGHRTLAGIVRKAVVLAHEWGKPEGLGLRRVPSA